LFKAAPALQHIRLVALSGYAQRNDPNGSQPGAFELSDQAGRNRGAAVGSARLAIKQRAPHNRCPEPCRYRSAARA
jgi:hypothetical protein